TRAAADTQLQANIDAEASTRAAADTQLQVNIDAEASTRAAADTQLQANIDTEASTRAAADTQLQANIDAEASTRAAADTQLQANIDAEASMREAGDQAIRDEIATKVTTNALEVNGDSTFNGAVTVNNVKSTTTVDQAGTPATTPEFGADTDGDGRPDTLIQTKEQTDAVTVSSQSQSYNENNLTFSSKTEKGTQTTTDQYTADIIYDQNGVATYGPNVANGQAVTSDLETIAEDSIIVGKETADSETALTIRSKDANGESATVVTSKSVTTGNVSASTITLAGKDLATTIAEGDAATLASANNYTDATATTLRDEAAAEKVRVDQAIADGDAATLVSANNYTDATATTLRGEAAAETTRVNQAIADGDATTLASANGYTDATATTLRGEAAAETTRVNKAIADGNTATLASANSYTNARVNQLNSRVDDVEKTAYRGIAIALAAQQAIPSIQPGQIAVFGGVGHYEGETAGAVGLVGALNDRTSLSAALGFAGGNEVGGRVGVAYVFGGK
ncbi:YadA-like family protein, partial [Acinetobacter venetianus]|uniref:YadA-like family protein n=1 Tax=Acinetobacter venetianus TaxID=52133 RepID=UPI0021505F8B